ncbi:MAG TPA: sigma-70 family RNA polymerase sigma factor [Candidatus Angelobacter sp.]|nr:sigma-70 family RNA polymerase sigma factor [Candidatus Angelobacter sp.]
MRTSTLATPATGSTDGSPAVAELLADELPGLLRYARSLVRDPGRAEDLVQDTVVRALERAATFRGESSLRTWLHRILHNLAIDGARRTLVDPVDVSDDAAGRIELLWQDERYTIDAELVVERAELRATLQDALLRLPLVYRSAVVLHDVEGLRMTEVAEIQRVSLPAAKQRLRRGRMMLVSELGPARRAAAAPGVPLRCWDARSQVSDYLDAELSEREQGLLERHLATCPTCPPLYAGLVGVRDALGSRRDPDDVVPAGILARVRAAAETA